MLFVKKTKILGVEYLEIWEKEDNEEYANPVMIKKREEGIRLAMGILELFHQNMGAPNG